MEPKRKTLKLSNKINELETIRLSLDELVDDWNIPAALGMTLNLVLEEAFTNVVNYAFTDMLEHTIEIIFEKHEKHLSICVIDDGIAYDPTQNTDPDLTLPVEDRMIGGLGIYLIKQMMDEVIYERKMNKNILVMRKVLES